MGQVRRFDAWWRRHSRDRRKSVLVTFDNYITSVFLYWDYARARLEAATKRPWLLQAADAIDPGDLNKFHTVIVVRGHSRRCLEIMQRAKQHGCRTIYDLDDDLLRLHEAFSDVNNPWVQTFGAARPEIEAMLREADVVKVYGEAAVGSFRSYNERVVAIRPFQIFDRDAPRPLSQRLPLSVGFLGSYFKDDEFGPVLSAIRRIRREGHPLYFEFFGFMPRELQNDAEISHIPWHSSYPEYRAKLAALEWHIGLAPLRDLQFHRGKTNAKYREYASAGIAGIYSDAHIYRSTVVQRKTGIIVEQENEQAWYGAILELAADARLRDSIGQNAFADVKANYRVEDYVASVATLIQELPAPRAVRE